MIPLAIVVNNLDYQLTKLTQARTELTTYLPLNRERLHQREIAKTIDSFIYRFTKLQDAMGSQFFPSVLDFLGNWSDSMSLIDILNELEKLELISEQEHTHWRRYRNLRNALTHDYPNNEQEIIENITLALGALEIMQSIYERVKAAISRK